LSRVIALWRIDMVEKFNPAAPDKYAAKPKSATSADQGAHDKLDAGLIDSFPASDPASAVQPAPPKPRRKEATRDKRRA
jgi:hypothetical protein